MTTLVDPVRRLADQPLEGFPRRRRGMDVKTAEEIIDAVVTEALAIVKPVLWNTYGGWEVLERLKALKSGTKEIP